MKQQSVTLHRIAPFYLERWAGEDGKLCEFSWPYGVVTAQWKTPKAASHVRHLDTVTALPAGNRVTQHDKFFRQADQAASDALDLMLANPAGTADMPAELRNGWSRFLLSLVRRSPERVEQLRAKLRAELATRLPEIGRYYEAQRQPGDPETFKEFQELLKRDVEGGVWVGLLERVVDSLTVGTLLNAMRWSVVTFEVASHVLMTSDRPVCMTEGIDRPAGYVALPVGPRQVFLATNTPVIEAALRQGDGRALLARLNDFVVRQAAGHVYATDDRQLRFVANRLRR